MTENQTASPPARAARPRLLDLAREAIRRRHYSYRTEETYLHWMKRFILFSGKRHPRELGAAEVTAFLNHLVRERSVGAATQNQALADLRVRLEFPVTISQCPARSSAGIRKSSLTLFPPEQR